MRKKQKINKKKQSQRAYKDFIFLVNWHKNKFDVISHISNIYENEGKKEVSVYRLYHVISKRRPHFRFADIQFCQLIEKKE